MKMLSNRDSNVTLTILEESSRMYNIFSKNTITGVENNMSSKNTITGFENNMSCKNTITGFEKTYLIEISGYITDLFLLTKNTNPLIRMAAHSFLFIISEHEITIQERLFLVLCDNVNDVDIRVRVNCCRLMGRFKQVSKELLLQTLSKKEVLEKTKVLRFKISLERWKREILKCKRRILILQIHQCAEPLFTL
jgi:hypothetical protein